LKTNKTDEKGPPSRGAGKVYQFAAGAALLKEKRASEANRFYAPVFPKPHEQTGCGCMEESSIPTASWHK